MALEFFNSIVALVLTEPVNFDLTTVNDLPGASIDALTINAKRTSLGFKLGYAGPLDLTKLGRGVQEAANRGAKALKKHHAWAHGPQAKCLEKAAADKLAADKLAADVIKRGRGVCMAKHPLAGRS